MAMFENIQKNLERKKLEGMFCVPWVKVEAGRLDNVMPYQMASKHHLIKEYGIFHFHVIFFYFVSEL